jgi:hypothetical protein
MPMIFGLELRGREEATSHVLVDRSMVVKEIQKMGNDVLGWA